MNLYLAEGKVLIAVGKAFELGHVMPQDLEDIKTAYSALDIKDRMWFQRFLSRVMAEAIARGQVSQARAVLEIRDGLPKDKR